MMGSEQQGLWSGVLGHWRQAQLCLSSVNWEAIGQPRPRALKIFSHLTQQCRFEESIPGKHFGMQAELSVSLLLQYHKPNEQSLHEGNIHTYPGQPSEGRHAASKNGVYKESLVR